MHNIDFFHCVLGREHLHKGYLGKYYRPRLLGIPSRLGDLAYDFTIIISWARLTAPTWAGLRHFEVQAPAIGQLWKGKAQQRLLVLPTCSRDKQTISLILLLAMIDIYLGTVFGIF
jgi:hypothetical protein